jgi:hypothetical protein
VPSPADLAAEVETHKRVLDTLLLLPEPYRTVLWMRFFQDRSPRAIARLMNVPHETVRTHLRRGIERMRAALDERDAGHPRPWRLALVPLLGHGGNHLGDWITGGIVMTAKTKTALGLAGAALVLAGTYAAGWWPDFGRNDDPRRGTELTAASNRASDEGPALAGRKELSATPSADPLPPPVDLSKVDRERDLHGVVVRTDGTPVAGARLQALNAPWQGNGLFNLNLEEDLVGTTRSASDGTFALRLAPAACVNLVVSAAGFASLRLAQVNAGERLRVTLDAGVDLIVSLKDEMGQPVAGCSGRLFRTGLGLGGIDVRRDAESDASGELRYPGLPGGLPVLLEAKPRSLGYFGWGWVDIQLPASGTHRHALVLPKGRTVVGRVSNEATGAPIAGARVGANWTASFAVATDADGMYRYEGWTGEGITVLTAYADGHIPVWEKVGPADRVDFRVSRGVRVAGRVVGPDGSPTVGALVAGQGQRHEGPSPLGPAFPASMSSNPIAKSDGSGAFVLEGVQTDRDFAVAVQSIGWATHTQRLGKERLAAGLATGTLDLGEIRLDPEHWLRGTVTNAEGAPVSRVAIIVHGERPDRPPTTRWDGEGYRYGASAERYTDDLGRFVVRGLSVGAYRVIARPQGQDEVLASVRVPEEGDAPPVRLVVPQVRVIDVEVVTSEGRPIEGLDVSTQGGTLPTGGTTDKGGYARLKLTSDVRSVSLGFNAQQLQRYLGKAWHELRPDETKVRFTLYECLPASGRVVDEDGNGVEGARVEVLDVGGTPFPWALVSESEGRFRSAIPVGRVVTLRVNGSGQKKLPSGVIQSVDLGLEGEVHGVAPGATDVVLRVAKRGSNRRLKVHVTLPDGSPAVGSNVHVHFAWGGGRYAIVNDTGKAVIEGLPDRAVTIEVTPNRIGPTARKLVSVTVKDVMPGNEPVRVVLREGVFVRGRLLDETGEGVPNVEINVRAGEAWVPGSRMKTGDRGSFVLLLDPIAFPTVDLDATMTTAEGLLLSAVLRGLRVEETTIELKLQRAR